MRFSKPLPLMSAVALVFLSAIGSAQAPSRGSIAVYPVVYDKSGTDTSRAMAKEALKEALKKGGFVVANDSKAAAGWAKKGYRTPTSNRPPTSQSLLGLAKAIGVRYVCTASVSFHTRSIWVNLGPKTISNCHITLTIVDSQTGKVAYEGDGEGRSDEKSDGLKVAAAVLISPLVTAVSGGPKTPQETRAAQIASARALEKFVVVQ